MIIYLITCAASGKSYVGQTIFSVEKRWHEHLYLAKTKSKQALHRALRKYGADAFTIRVLCRCNSLEELDRLERDYIIKLGTRSPYGYNSTAGGEGTHGPMAGLKHSDKSKKQISESQLGKLNGMFGKKHTEETKRKMSESRFGKPCPSRGRPRLRGMDSPFYGKILWKQHGMLGKKHTEETKRKLSIAGTGKKHTEETKRKMRLTHFIRTIAWG